MGQGLVFLFVFAAVGIALGIGITFVLKAVMDRRFPTLLFPVTPGWITYATVIALAILFSALMLSLESQFRPQ